MSETRTQKKPLPTIWRTPDELWEIIEPILAEHDPPKSAGRPRIDQRAALDAIIFRMRSGCQWNRLPEEFPDDSSVHRTFQRWIGLGVLDLIWERLIEECEELGGDFKATLKDVYERYEAWCEEGGERAETKRKFNARLTEREQFVDRRSGPGGLREWHGLGLLTKRNAGFAGKLTECFQNHYKQLVSDPRSGNGHSSVSTSVRSVDEAVHRDPEAWEGSF